MYRFYLSPDSEYTCFPKHCVFFFRRNSVVILRQIRIRYEIPAADYAKEPVMHKLLSLDILENLFSGEESGLAGSRIEGYGCLLPVKWNQEM